MHLLAAIIASGTTGTAVVTVPFSPSSSALPGTQQLGQIANGLGFWALIAAVVGVVVGGVMWAFGHYSQNYQQAYNGRKGVLVAGLAALLVGAAPQLIHFFLSLGAQVKQ
ncbi:MAG: DUF6112 family protein [Actinomycetota bacterium]|jgi:type IV secretory pathway VirB2 component (pilin)|nr:DUF6112 family protein [Actinomycetota bacterium]